jgi:VIT1/CCC1 family predicted Fe2+/Mn2+ transporter
VAGANFDPKVAVVLGFSNLIGDALSMGVGDYLSERAEIDFARNEMRREAWEVENYIEGEKREMIELYVAKGMTEEDATTIIESMSKYPKIFVDTM